MDFDMALESLRSLFPSCNIVLTRAPSYIRVHTGVDEEILLVNIRSKLTSASGNQTNSGDDNQEVLELTGSPLKLDLSLRNILEDTMPLDETQHWSRDEISHLPTTVQVARNICNQYIQLTKDTAKDSAVPLWAVTNGSDEQKILLLSTRPYKNHFDRGVVSYEGEIGLDELSFEKLADADVQLTVECRLRVGGMSASGHPVSEVRSSPHAGLTQLRCEWNERTLEIPQHSARVTLEQEVIVGHEMTPCRMLWKSICAMDSINRALVDMQATGYAAISLDGVGVRPPSTIPGPTLQDGLSRLSRLLSDVETYTYAAGTLKGGCIFIPEDPTSLKRCLNTMEARGSSNDFTYQLWDILKDCETADDVLTLLLHALKAVSSGNMKPFITPSNKTYLAKLFLKLSRGHSQTPTVLKNLRASPHQALSLIGQVGLEKTAWELTHLFTLVDNSFGVSNVLSLQKGSDETIEHINQTIHDMTMGCGDLTLNPFENRTATENSIRLDSESFFECDHGALSIDNFASLKKLGLVSGSVRPSNEAPLILDEIDISCWKKMLTRFVQLYVCLEHLNRMQQVLRLDMASLSARAAGLQETYLSDRSPVRTVPQVLSDPVQWYSTPVSAAMLREHLSNKLASFYRVHIARKADETVLTQDAATTHVFSQRSVFPPAIWRVNEAETDGNATMNAGIRYHHTKYLHIGTRVVSAHCSDNSKGI